LIKSQDEFVAVEIVGCAQHSGQRDGVGPYARFGTIERPIVTDKYLFLDDWHWQGNGRWKQRLARVDLATLQVETMRLSGIRQGDLTQLCASDRAMYGLRVVWDDGEQEYHAQLMRAWLGPHEDDPGVAEAGGSMDLSVPAQPMTFRLAGGAALQIDRRILAGRSVHFKRLLASGMREANLGEVDLTGDADADEACVAVVLRYILSGTWHGSKIAGLAFRVRALAHRWEMPRLVELAEYELCQLLNVNTVLDFLGRVVDTGCYLEEACWALMREKGPEVMQAQGQYIDDIIAENPHFAKQLILWGAGCPTGTAAQSSRRSAQTVDDQPRWQ
jgi:hypothetical protein